MPHLEVNCTHISEMILNCSAPLAKDSSFVLIGSGSMLLLSVLGFFPNTIALYIFDHKLKIGSTKFLKLLRIYTFNCAIANLNDIVSVIILLFLTLYSDGSTQYISSYSYVIFYQFFYKNIWSLTFTFSSLLDLITKGLAFHIKLI